MSKSVGKLLKVIVVMISICLFVLLSCDKDKVSNPVYNGLPHITYYDTINTSLGLTINDTIDYMDSNSTILYHYYNIVSFDGPTGFGDGLQLDSATGVWSWEIGPDQSYAGKYNLIIAISDYRDLCNNLDSSFTDTIYYAYYRIDVSNGISISIDVIYDQLQGHEAELSINLNSPLIINDNDTVQLEAFELMIAYDASMLRFITADAGSLIDHGKFEHFSTRLSPSCHCGDDCPSGLLSFIAIRDENNGMTNPFYTSGPGELARITFSVSNDYNYAGEFAPVRFYWCDCWSNELLDNSLQWWLLGRDVYDQAGNNLSDSSETFGYGGPEDSCLDTTFAELQSEDLKRIPVVDFHGGGIAIIPVESIDDRCDINLNGIINEIADAVVFTNYFIYGPSAFTIDYDLQTACSDINNDGVPLTVADLVYMVRIIVGDALPLPPRPNPCAEAGFSVQDRTVSVETNVDLGAVWLLFSGTITPELANDAGNMDIGYYQTGNKTRVFIFSFEQGDAITSGDLLHFSGEASLDSVETAEYRGTVMTAIIE
jgi:hypothetical protein